MCNWETGAPHVRLGCVGDRPQRGRVQWLAALLRSNRLFKRRGRRNTGCSDGSHARLHGSAALDTRLESDSGSVRVVGLPAPGRGFGNLFETRRPFAARDAIHALAAAAPDVDGGDHELL